MFLADKTDNNYLDCSYEKNDDEPRHALAGNLADCLGPYCAIPITKWPGTDTGGTRHCRWRFNFLRPLAHSLLASLFLDPVPPSPVVPVVHNELPFSPGDRVACWLSNQATRNNPI